MNIEFLFHLATQIKAVVQYRMDSKNDQKFTVTDQELEQLPSEIKQMASFHSYLISEDLIKLIANDDAVKEKIILLFSNQYILLPQNVSPLDFYNMIKLMDNKEITYVSYLCYMIQNYDKLNSGVFDGEGDKEGKETFEIAEFFRSIGVRPNKVISLFVQIKKIFGKGISIDNESIGKLFKVLRYRIAYQDYGIDKLNYKINYIYDSNIDINNKKYKL